MNYYNGYTPRERVKKLREHHKLFPNQSHPYFNGACHMCGDPHSPVAPHSEDYSEPFLWYQPAEYALCSTCHSRIHKRFKSPFAWEAYKMHLRRGGYGSDLKSLNVARILQKLDKMLEGGSSFFLEAMRPAPPSDIWWEDLVSEPATLTEATARKR